MQLTLARSWCPPLSLTIPASTAKICVAHNCFMLSAGWLVSHVYYVEYSAA